MEKEINYIVVTVSYRQKIESSYFETYEEAYEAMEKDFLSCLGDETYQEGLTKNEAPYDEDWWLRDDCAWISDNAFFYNIEWYIVRAKPRQVA